MDAKIAAVLRATADAKESGRKAKEAVSQLRFRVRPNVSLHPRDHVPLPCHTLYISSEPEMSRTSRIAQVPPA